MMRAEVSVLALAALGACGPAAVTEGPPSSSTTSTVEETSMGRATTTGTTSSSASSSSGSVDSGSTTTGEAADDTGPPPPPGFLNYPDTPSGPCSTWTENCPPGEKCMPVATDGGNALNAWDCRPVVQDPAAPGEPCTITMGSGVEGYDTCEKHSMCLFVDSDSGEGTCVEMCVGTEQTPTCLEPDMFCAISGGGFLNYCVPTCDPLVQNCLDGEACYPVNSSFVCAPAVPSDGGGTYQAPCEYLNACLPGLYCGYADGVCPEGVSGCCLPFFDLSQPECPEPLICLPGFEPGVGPPGLENVGVCHVR